MRVLIVESDTARAALWRRHLVEADAEVMLATGQAEAARALLLAPADVIILGVALAEGSAIAVADLAGYRRPEAQIIFVSGSHMFTDGSLFRLCANACAMVPPDVPPADLVALVEHHGRPSRG